MDKVNLGNDLTRDEFIDKMYYLALGRSYNWEDYSLEEIYSILWDYVKLVQDIGE